MRRYSYVGPEDLSEIPFQTARYAITNREDVVRWAAATSGRPGVRQPMIATFIVDLEEQLWIADRTSEHIACARGQDVLAAGEITFHWDRQIPVVEAVTNQSTGYCPEPESWEVVSRVLERVEITHPDGFTTIFLFRRCPCCRMQNIVKEGWFFCSICDSELPATWNFADSK